MLRNIPIPEVIIALGGKINPSDKNKWDTCIGPISVKQDKFYCWTTNTGGGGALDLTMALLSQDFLSARLWLANQFGISQPIEATSRDTIKFQAPKSCPRHIDVVFEYLNKTRGLPQSILSPLITQGYLYSDQRQNAVFLLLGKKKTPVGAELRGTGSKPWKGISPGSHRHKGFFYCGPTSAKACVLCESAIDSLSLLAMHSELLCISTSGVCANPNWINALLNRNYQVYCGFDNDSAGEQAWNKMSPLFPRIKRLRPKRKDWNEDWLNR